MRELLTIVAGLTILAGCSSVTPLRMDAERPVLDQSVVALSVARVPFEKVAVFTPDGMQKKEAETLTVAIERELLRHQIRVVSAAHMRRDVAERIFTEPGKPEGAPAAEPEPDPTRPEAILQIANFDWTEQPTSQRLFILDEVDGEKAFREVAREDYDAAKGAKLAFPSPELRFLGRFLNAKTGESMATLEVKSPANFNNPGRYIATVEIRDSKAQVVTQSFEYGSPAWLAEAKRNTEDAVIKAVCERISRLEDGLIQPPKPADDAKPEAVIKEELEGERREPAKDAVAAPAAPAPKPEVKTTPAPPPTLPPAEPTPATKSDDSED